MKKTLFLAAVLTTVAMTAPVVAETLTLESDTVFSSVSGEYDTVDLNHHKLTFNADYEGDIVIQGSGAASILEATNSAAVTLGEASAADFTGAIAVSAGSSLTTGAIGGEETPSIQHVSMTGDGSSVTLGNGVTLSHGDSFDLNTRSTYGIQKWGGDTSVLSLTGTNTAKGLYVAQNETAVLKLVSADSDARTLLTVTNNLNVDENKGKVIVSDGATLIVQKYNTANVTTGFRELATATSGLTKVETEGTGAIGIAGNATVDYSGTANTNQTYDFIRNLHVMGNVELQTNANWSGNGNYATWALKDHMLIVDGNLWLKNRQYMTVGDASELNTENGSLVVGGQVQLGHNQNPADGKYQGHLTINTDGRAQMSQLYFYGGCNQVLVNGSIAFTKADGNVLAGNGTTTTDAQTNTIIFDNATLDATANSWTMTGGNVQNNQKAAITLSGTNTLNTGDNTITIGSAQVSGTITGAGALTLNNATLSDNLIVKGVLNETGDVASAVTVKVNNLGGEHSLTVEKGATLQANGTKSEIILKEGATLKAVGTGNFNAQQLGVLTLGGNATIDLSQDKYGLINRDSSSFATATLNMGENNVLTLSGSGRFCLMDVATTGTGTIKTADYLQIAHSGVEGHTADLSGVVLNMNNTHLVISSGNTLKVSGMDVTGMNCAIEKDGAGDTGTRDLVITGDGATHTYKGGFEANSAINLSMSGLGTQEFNLSIDSTLNSVTATAGEVKFTGQTSAKTLTVSHGVTVADGATLTIGDKANVTVNAEAADNVTVSGTMNVAAGSTATLTKLDASAATAQVNVAGDLLVTVGQETKVTVNALQMEGGSHVTLGSVDDHADRTLALQSLTVTGSGAEINADLDLSGATVTLNGNSVELGCNLKLDGTAITLSDADIALIQDAEGEGLVIFTGVDSLTIGSTTYTTEYHNFAAAAGLTLITTATLPDVVFVNFSSESGKVTLSVVPEPATATLSLLALAALAARRKRK